jgi:hypothetical protein
MTTFRWLYIFGLAACSSVSLGGPGTIVRVEPELPGFHCEDGGVAIHTGLDHDGDLYLDDDEITSTQYVCDGFAPVQCAGGNVLTGTIAVREPTDWDQLEGVHCVDGTLLIAGLDDDRLADLSDLSIVTGDLIVAANPNVTTLAGLGAIERVGGDYLIQGNDSLTDLNGLARLIRAASLRVVGNNAMTVLNGVEQISEFGGGILIANNNALESLSGFDNLVTLNGTITIEGNRNLTDLGALGRLKHIVMAEIRGNAALPSLRFDALETIEVRFLVDDNPALIDVTLSALTTIGDGLRFEGNGALQSVSFPQLLTAGGLTLRSANALSSVSAPLLLNLTLGLTMATLPSLSSVDLPELVSIGGDMVVSGNSVLPSFAGFDSLATIGGDFRIRDNPGPRSLAGLDALDFVAGDLEIVDNINLPTSQANALANRITVGGAVTISGNQ